MDIRTAKNEFVKKWLQEGMRRANKQNWRIKMTTKQNIINKQPSQQKKKRSKQFNTK